MRWSKIIIGLSTIGLLLISFQVAWGGGAADARAVGMGGAYTALARDLDAPNWNPANLGLSDGNGFTINIFNAGLKFKNSSFSLADYNRYNGKFLTEGDKADIINSIPTGGLSLDLGAEASAMNFSVGNFAMTYKGYGVSSFNLAKDPFKLLLLGNAVMRDVSLKDTRGEAFALADAAISYGRAIQQWQGGEFSVGASAHFLKGLAYEKVVESEGGVSTTDTGFVGSGYVKVHSSLGGTGYTSDIGLAVRFEDNWFFSAVWQNIASKINWNTENEELLMQFQMRPITLEAMSDSSAADSLVTSSDTSYSIAAFSSKLSPVVRLGLAREFRKLTFSLDWEQNLFNAPGRSVNPRLASGVEYRPWIFLPLRAGMAFGGGQGSIYSIGFGVSGGPFNFDLGLANSGSLSPAGTKGASLAVGMSLRF